MTSRMAYLLGELRREMNGAVVGSMRYYGAEWGLNYGVSIPTIRGLGRSESTDHHFAKYLYEQQVRELRMVSLWFADPKEVSGELDLWARGIINSEIAEEAAFVLLYKVPTIAEWLTSQSEILQYCAVMAIAGGHEIELDTIETQLIKLLKKNPPLLSKAIIVLLERVLRQNNTTDIVSQFLDSMPQNGACSNIRDEIAWRSNSQL